MVNHFITGTFEKMTYKSFINKNNSEIIYWKYVSNFITELLGDGLQSQHTF